MNQMKLEESAENKHAWWNGEIPESRGKILAIIIMRRILHERTASANS